MSNRSKRDSTKRTATRSQGRKRARRKLDIGNDVQTSYFFMLNCLLHSRVHTGLESNSDYYDEDVNVYIAHLLNAHVDPKYLARTSSCIALGDADLRRMIDETNDDRDRFMIYKTNADYLLIAVSVFDRFEDKHFNRHAAFHISKETYVGRAATYYEIAASYATKLNRGTGAVAEVLHKLSIGIDTYVKILSYLRGQYLDFIRRYSPGELFHLERSIQQIERDETIERLRNEFLDTYNAWLKTPTEDLKGQLLEQAKHMKGVDPSFEFDPPA